MSPDGTSMTSLGFFTRDGEPVKNLSTTPAGKYITTVWNNCHRCGGQGGAEQWKATGWTCYQCNGRRGQHVIVPAYTAEKLEKLNATKAKKDAVRMAKTQAKVREQSEARAAALGDFMAIHGGLVAKATALAASSSFLADLVAKLENYLWSEKQVAAVAKVVAQIEETKAKRAGSGHIGKVGERLTVAVTVERVHSFERPCFNANWLTEMCHFVTMRDAAGNALVSKGKFHAAKDSAITIRATVKAHGEYKGEKQTIINRVQVVP